MLDQLEGVVLVLVGDGLEEEALQVLLEGEVDHGLHGTHAALARDLRHGAVRSLGRVHEEDPLVGGGPRLGSDGLALVALPRGLDEPALHLRVAQPALLLFQRQRPQLLPHGQAVEGQAGLEREHHGEGAAVHLGEHAATRGSRLLEEADVLPPEIGGLAAAEEAPGDGAAGVDGEIAQPHVIVAQPLLIVAESLAGDLEDAGVHLAHDAHEPSHLVPRGEAAGHGAAIGGLVARRARGRQAHGAGGQPAPQLLLHRSQVILISRLVEGPLAHDVGAQGGVAEIARVVDPLGQRLDRVEELREGRPRPVDARLHRLGRDVLGALEIADDEVPVRLGAGREGEAAVAHDHAGDAVPARAGAEGIPEDLGVHVRVAVHESWRDHLTLGVDDLAGRLPDAADGGDASAHHADVAPVSGLPGSIHHPAVLDHEVKGHGLLLSVVGAHPQSRPMVLQLQAQVMGDAR